MRHSLFVTIAGIATFSAILSAQNGSQFRDWQDSALADNPRLTPKLRCAALVSQTGYAFSIVAATAVRPSADTPGYCRVSGLIQPEVRFEVDLPDAWNG